MEWTCRCGAVAADVAARGGTRAVCYCPSCRKFSQLTGAEASLDPQGGSDLFQIAPEDMTITRGADKLAWLRLTDRGPCRWYTTCCNTPLGNTLKTPQIPFITLLAHRLADPEALGPAKVRAFRRYASGRVPDDAGGVWPLYLAFGRRVLKSRLTGGWRRNPLFEANGRPVGPRRQLGD